MALISGSLPHCIVYQTSTGWICKGADQRGYGKTYLDAYNEWVYLIRYNSDGRNW